MIIDRALSCFCLLSLFAAETSESLLAKLEDAAVAAGGVNLDTAEFAAHMDSTDELGAFRSRFAIPHAPKNEDAEAVYLCGNSLGLMPLATQVRLACRGRPPVV